MAGIFPASGVSASEAINSLLDPNVVVGCEELWHSTGRCQPRFDPAAANAVMSELLNLINCAGVAYDCKRLDNLCLATTELIHDVIHGCHRPFPAAEGCTIRQLVLSTDAEGCTSLAYFDTQAARLAISSACSVWPVGIRQLPANPAAPTTFYTNADLAADVVGGTIDEGLLTTNALATITFDVPCDDTIVEIELGASVVFAPAAAPNGAISQVVYRIDGEFTVQSGVVSFISAVTNYERLSSSSMRKTFAAGTHTVEFYVVSESGAKPPAQIGASCLANGTSSISVSAFIPTI